MPAVCVCVCVCVGLRVRAPWWRTAHVAAASDVVDVSKWLKDPRTGREKEPLTNFKRTYGSVHSLRVHREAFTVRSRVHSLWAFVVRLFVAVVRQVRGSSALGSDSIRILLPHVVTDKDACLSVCLSVLSRLTCCFRAVRVLLLLLLLSRWYCAPLRRKGGAGREFLWPRSALLPTHAPGWVPAEKKSAFA